MTDRDHELFFNVLKRSEELSNMSMRVLKALAEKVCVLTDTSDDRLMLKLIKGGSRGWLVRSILTEEFSEKVT